MDLKTQEKYYTKIIEQYLIFCTAADDRDELLQRFAALEIGDGASPATSRDPAARPSMEALQSPNNAKALSDIMMALRKLREGIVASNRIDDFAIQAYLFSIRLSVLAKQPESYHPAILYVLRRLDARWMLSSLEFDELVSYLVLDMACRRMNLAEAYSLRHRYRLKDPKVDAVLHALVHDNYFRFHRMKAMVDGHRARIMDFAEDEVRMQTLKAFGRTYLSVDLDFLEATTHAKWDDLVKKDGVGWEADSKKVVIRRVQAK